MEHQNYLYQTWYKGGEQNSHFELENYTSV